MRLPDFRTSLGLAACGIYFWRIQDPKGSYALFYDATDWLTVQISGLLVDDGTVVAFVRNAVNLILLDQVEGFLIGIVFVTMLAGILWPFKACGRWCAAKLTRIRHSRTKPPEGRDRTAHPAGPEQQSDPVLLAERLQETHDPGAFSKQSERSD